MAKKTLALYDAAGEAVIVEVKGEGEEANTRMYSF